MIKRFFLLLFFAALIIASFIAWRLIGPGTAFSGEKYNLYIGTGMTYDEVLAQLEKDTVVKSIPFFKFVAGRLGYTRDVKAGKYEIPQDMSLLTMVRMLHNGQQTPVHFTILKVRTREGLAGMIGRKFEPDSLAVLRFLSNNDSLIRLGVDTNTWLTLLLPDTYTFFWNSNTTAILRKISTASKIWWTPERVEKARQRGLTPVTAYTLASIVEEETNDAGDKGKITSVYLNRLAKGMRLGADPTVKYALKEFELKRIYEKHLKVESPYNTYLNAGLPPGPICTPSVQTLEAVLDSPQTDYLYFVAKPDFSGTSNFAATYEAHLQYAKAWQHALDEQAEKRAMAEKGKKAAK